ncbi:MAG: L-glutamate gamma-semialdehyde dehydrogenase [Flavobacteriales bacterium]|nr:L-glutamate gamma-semialdehyde dehydrogenase [Bacteroidota bacterium]MCB9239554.1 L-glutamate gamma-semialdehyde dehydrogenase [Flavobacteriales bacterium]
MNGFFKVPTPKNEPVKNYAPGSPETIELQAKLTSLRSVELDIPMYIGGEEIRTQKTKSIHPPHDLKHTLGQFHQGDATHVEKAIESAMTAKESWEALSWENRASIFLRAAELIAGPYRAEINAATMLCQSKNAYQAEIDAACELIDFFRFNVQYMTELYAEQPPENSPGVWNRLEYRPLEGFVFALTPFNFTSIAANLPGSPALMGNTVVWKPAESQIYSANVIMKVFKEAGLPDGVINLVYVSGPVAGDVIFKHRDFAGLHFTGSTGVFQHLWKEIGQNIAHYKSYPRIVGETGGKDFVMVHPSSNATEVAVALARGAFEFQGQKCSAASRAYIPQSLWGDVRKDLVAILDDMKMGPPEDFRNFINAVIDQRAYTKISGYITQARQDGVEIVSGGNFNDKEGYFIEPTVLLAKDPKYTTMCEEIFGPILTIYVYPDDAFESTLHLLDETGIYALTGSIFSRDRHAVELATKVLSNAAGNFYINDKPTGAVVGQQPFGGARGSGTNDKAGAKANLMRWVSMRTIKENFVPPTDYKYPFHSA